jgi:Protein of unknown function (DUF2809)
MIFQSYYFIWLIILFFIEVYIALYIHDDFIRPYVGDALVVILIYVFVRSFFAIPILRAATGVLIFSFGVEILQYFKIVEILGLNSSSFARTVIGTTFAWNDIIAYCMGFVMLLCFEKSLGIYKKEWYSIK